MNFLLKAATLSFEYGVRHAKSCMHTKTCLWYTCKMCNNNGKSGKTKD